MSHRFRTANKDTPAAKARRQKYNSREHKQAGTRLTAEVAAGHAHCWRCGRPIPPGTRRGIGGWIVGHDDHNVNIIRGAEHETCNRKAAQRKGGRTALAQRQPSMQVPRQPVRIPPPHW